MSQSWRPSASITVLQQRAELFRSIRQFFYDRNVMEVDTPILCRGGTVDPQIDSFSTFMQCNGQLQRYNLHTSPEFAMKRLLAAGSDSIYQLSHVFRQGEVGSNHNPEFMLLEWYRVGWDFWELLQEIKLLMQHLGVVEKLETISYQQLWIDTTAIDPLHTSELQLQQFAMQHNLCDRTLQLTLDQWQNLIFSLYIQPDLAVESMVAIYHYPASQASLAKLHPQNRLLAERFELFYRGVELGNGFSELTDAAEQRERFNADVRQRSDSGSDVPDIDENFLAALEAGMPEAAGVAIGIDRLLMAKLGVEQIESVMPFAFAIA